MTKTPDHPIASDLSRKASQDTTRYDALEVGHALTDDVYEQLLICAAAHEKIFDMPTFCIGLYVAGDPLLHNLRRHKYCAFPWLPEPRPNQSVFLFRKSNQKIRRLWSLPKPEVMAVISEMSYVAPQWQQTKSWCDSFFNKTFWEHIRTESGIKMLSQKEWLDLYSPEISEPLADESKGSIADTFDFSKIAVEKVIDSDKPLSD